MCTYAHVCIAIGTSLHSSFSLYTYIVPMPQTTDREMHIPGQRNRQKTATWGNFPGNLERVRAIQFWWNWPVSGRRWPEWAFVLILSFYWGKVRVLALVFGSVCVCFEFICKQWGVGTGFSYCPMKQFIWVNSGKSSGVGTLLVRYVSVVISVLQLVRHGWKPYYTPHELIISWYIDARFHGVGKNNRSE